MKSELAVHYLDLTNTDQRELAAISEQIQSYNPFLNKDWVFLKTCHRLEFFTDNPMLKNPLPQFFKTEGYSVFSTEKVIERMLLIACGCLSQIVAETYISKQFQDSVLYSIANERLIKIFEKVGFASESIREKFHFYAIEDYNRIAFKLLNNFLDDRMNVVIIGGGLLARSIGDNLCSLYHVIFITRSPHKLKKTLQKENPTDSFEIVKTGNFEFLPITKYICFVATGNYNNEYCHSLLPIMRDNRCKAIVDFSAIPQFKDYLNKPYITMYDAEYTQIVQLNNTSIKNKYEIVTNEISKYAQFISANCCFSLK